MSRAPKQKADRSIIPYDPDFEETMKAAEGFMRRYRNALRELAK